VERILCDLLRERHKYENDAAVHCQQAKELERGRRTQLIGAYQLLKATGDDVAAREHIRARARELGSNCNSRSRLHHHALDIAFPRAKESPLRLTNSLRTLYSWTIRGGQLRGLTVGEFAKSISTGQKGRGGIKALAQFAKELEGKPSKAVRTGQDIRGAADQARVGAHTSSEIEYPFLL
jgi:hypothetical protein